MATPTVASAFRRLDRSGDGILTKPDLTSAIDSAMVDNGFDFPIGTDELSKKTMDWFDQDSDGAVGEAEFNKSLYGLALRLGPVDTWPQRGAEMFRAGDPNRDGRITTAEIRTLARALGAMSWVQEIALGYTVLDLLDENNDQALDQGELTAFIADVQALTSRPLPPT